MLTLLSGFFGALTVLGIFLLVTRLLLRRCYVYVYVKDEAGRKVPVLMGFVKPDGTFVDNTRKLPERDAVGRVTVRDEKGRVVLFFTETGDAQEQEVGYVDVEGHVFTVTDVQIGKVSPDGQRRWWELWLRRHAEVPTDDEDPVGKCIEALRFRARRPNELTLLARAGAALLLYYTKLKAEDETPRAAPHVLWDTALPAALFFAILFLLPGMTGFIESHEFLLNLLGSSASYVATGVALYVSVWLFLHFVKVSWLSFNNDVYHYLTMLNRLTGIRLWALVAAGLALLGFTEGVIHGEITYLPVYVASFVGFVIAYVFCSAKPWPVKPRARSESSQPQTLPPVVAGNIKREYSWDLLSSFKNLSLKTEVRFQDDEIDQVRKTNPFFENWQQASIDARQVAAALVQNGGNASQAQAIVSYMKDIARQNRLTAFEELQLALNFVQSPNVNYELDENCEEIGNRKEYFRLPAETLFDKRGDCDCKSVLAAALMKNLGYPVLLLLSSKAEHAAIAVGGAPSASDEDLFFFEHKGEHYYYCETTGEGWKVGQETDHARVIRSDPTAVIDLTL